MATRSFIAKEIGKDKYLSIYCHWDGYVKGNGLILYNNYNNELMVDKLLELGDLSSLAEFLEPNPNEEHTFEHPQKNVCVAYGRDRGEKNVEAKERTLKEIWDSWCEYVYIWKDDEWFVNRRGDGDDLIPLEMLLESEGLI